MPETVPVYRVAAVFLLPEQRAAEEVAEALHDAYGGEAVVSEMVIRSDSDRTMRTLHTYGQRP